MIDNNLIIDVGTHKGEDTEFFLKKGYKVVAIDADPNSIKYVSNKFSAELSANKLTALHYAIADKDDIFLDFNISGLSLWNSLKKSIADRNNLAKDSIKVECKTLRSILNTYGVPYYCKIDIEGYDELCLDSLKGSALLPTFISVESECIGENEIISEEQALATLFKLKELNYSKFKLVDQTSLEVLSPNSDFYDSAKLLSFKSPSISTKVRAKISKLLQLDTKPSSKRDELNKRFNHDFMIGSSGPFGNDLEGEWLDFETAKACLLKNRKDYFSLPNAVSYGFWCDWHATT